MLGESVCYHIIRMCFTFFPLNLYSSRRRVGGKGAKEEIHKIKNNNRNSEVHAKWERSRQWKMCFPLICIHFQYTHTYVCVSHFYLGLGLVQAIALDSLCHLFSNADFIQAFCSLLLAAYSRCILTVLPYLVFFWMFVRHFAMHKYLQITFPF